MSRKSSRSGSHLPTSRAYDGPVERDNVAGHPGEKQLQRSELLSPAPARPRHLIIELPLGISLDDVDEVELLEVGVDHPVRARYVA